MSIRASAVTGRCACVGPDWIETQAKQIADDTSQGEQDDMALVTSLQVVRLGACASVWAPRDGPGFLGEDEARKSVQAAEPKFRNGGPVDNTGVTASDRIGKRAPSRSAAGVCSHKSSAIVSQLLQRGASVLALGTATFAKRVAGVRVAIKSGSRSW